MDPVHPGVTSVGKNLIQDFMAVTFPMKLAIFCEAMCCYVKLHEICDFHDLTSRLKVFRLLRICFYTEFVFRACRASRVQSVFENTYFTFFQISKNMTYIFLKWCIKKSLAKV